MNKLWAEIVEKISAINANKLSFNEGMVMSVNQTEGSATVMPADSQVPMDIYLRAGFSDNGFTLLPAIGSRVIYGLLNENIGFLLMCSSVDKVVIEANEVVFNNGSLGGLVILNALVKKLNFLEQRLLSHQHITTEAGLPTLPDLNTNPLFNITVASDLANTKIKM